MKSIHSELSTHNNGKPAATVSRAILSSNFAWNSGDHMPGSSIKMDNDCDTGVGRSENDWAGLNDRL